MAGRKPKPTAVKKLEGNPGKRKLNTKEPIPAKGMPSRPDWLMPEAKKEWERLAELMNQMGVLTEVDMAAFAAYCQSYARWKEAQEYITSGGSTFETDKGYQQQTPWVGIANTNQKLMLQAASEFGLTPSSRSRIIPLQFYRYTKDGGKEKAVDHPLYFLLHDEPNPEMTSFVFRETLMTHLLLWGNAYSQIIRNARGEIIALYPLMPDRMTVNRDGDGQLYYEYNMSTDDAHTLKGSTVRLQPHDVLHIPGLGFDGLVGYSPIAMAKNAIGMAIACEEYGAKFFANGAAPSGVLEHPGTIKDRVRESWQSTFGGSANANKVAVLEEGMKYTPISISRMKPSFWRPENFRLMR